MNIAVIVFGMTLEVKIMTKKDEFIEKIEQLDPHLEATKYHNEVNMIIWYVNDNDLKMPFVTFTYINGIPVVETDCNRFAKDDLVLYGKIINLCTEYFSFLYEEEQ